MEIKKNNYILRFIASFYLLLMGQQYVWLEGDLVSPVKVTAMCVSPLIIIFAVPRFSKAVGWGLVYLLWLFASMYLRFDNPRLETLGYSAMFFCMYMMFYNLVYAGAFTREFFQNLLKAALCAYIIVIAVQQIWSVTGGGELPLINFYYVPPDSAMKVPGLSLEPSHSARIMGILFFGFLKTTEFINGEPVTLAYLFSKYRFLLLGFIYTMISMFSGTAIFVLGILSLYFMSKKQIFYTIPFFAIFMIWLFNTDYEPVQRMLVTSEAALTGDTQNVIEADHSAAARVAPLLNAFALDFGDSRTWLGYGTDVALADGHLNEMHTVWTDRGVITYFLGWLLVFSCAIRKFLSIPTLCFLFLVQGSVANVYFPWMMLMIFTVLSYFFYSEKVSANNITSHKIT